MNNSSDIYTNHDHEHDRVEVIDPVSILVALSTLGTIIAVLNVTALVVKMLGGVKVNSNDVPLINLLMVNVIIGAVALPMYGMKKQKHGTLDQHKIFCSMWRYFYFTTVHVAMSSVVIMTLDRIMALKWPLRYNKYLRKSRMIKLVIGMDVFFVLFDLIPFLPLGHKFDDNETCHYIPFPAWAIVMNIITMATPLPLIFISYSYMLKLAFSHTMKDKKQSLKRKSSRAEKIKTVMTLGASKKVAWIVGTYIVLWGPGTVYYLIVWLCPKCVRTSEAETTTWMRFFFKVCVLSHSLVAPVIFCFTSKVFRKDARRMIRLFSERTEERMSFIRSSFATSSDSSKTNDAKKNNIQRENVDTDAIECTSLTLQ